MAKVVVPDDEPEVVEVALDGLSGLSSGFLVMLSVLGPTLRPGVFVDSSASSSVLLAAMSTTSLTVRLIRKVSAGKAGGDDVAAIAGW